MEGDQLKIKPRDYPEDHPFIDLLRYKSYLAVHNVTDSEVISKIFLNYAAKIFEALKPFDDFLNQSLENI